MCNMGSSSFILIYIIINVYVHIYSRTLFNYMNGTGDNNHSKGATIKIVIASCQPLNSLMNYTLVAFTSASNFQ